MVGGGFVQFPLKPVVFLVLAVLCLVFMVLIVYGPSDPPIETETPLDLPVFVDFPSPSVEPVYIVPDEYIQVIDGQVWVSIPVEGMPEGGI